MTAEHGLESVYNAADYRRAFLVGWRFAQLNAKTTHAQQILAVYGGGGYLPGLPEFTPEQRTLLIWSRLKLDLLGLPGGDLPTIQKEVEFADKALAKDSLDESAINSSIRDAFNTALVQVYITHPHLGKAIDLGHHLASLVFGPASATGEVTALKAQLGAELVERTCLLLRELQSAFPLRAAAAVSGSLAYWQRWVEVSSRDDDSVRKELHCQGERWQGLLTGEIHADDLLALHDYRQAIWDYLRQMAKLCRRNPWLWMMLSALVAVTGSGIFAIVQWAPKGAAVIAAIIATGAGALGITWKTAAVTAGKMVALLERPVLDQQLSEAVKIAAFIPPVAGMGAAEVLELRDAVRREVPRDERRAPGRQRAVKWPKWLRLPGRSGQPVAAPADHLAALPAAGSEAAPSQ